MRNLSLAEKGMVSMKSKGCKIYSLTFAYNFTAKRFEKEIIQNVANYIVKTHVLLQHTIVDSDKEPKFLKCAQDVVSVSEEVFPERKNQMVEAIEEELETPFSQGEIWFRIRLLQYEDSNTTDVVLSTDHTLMDGQSWSIFTTKVFHLHDQVKDHHLILESNEAPEQFPPSGDNIFPLPVFLLVPKGLWNYTSFTEFGTLKTIGFPARKDTDYLKPKSELVQWRTLVASLEYDQETTEKFIQLCKKQGVTVGALMILILSISGLKFALSYDDYPDAEARHIWFDVFVDTRGLALKKIKNFSVTQSGTFGGFSLNLGLSTKFIRRAEQDPMGCVKVIGQSVKEKIAAGDHLFNTALNLLVFEDSFVEQSNEFLRTREYKDKVAPMFTFSNVGDLDRGLKDLYDWTTSSVKEAYGVAGAQSSFPMANINFYKIGNLLRLNFDACEVATSKPQMQEFLAVVKSVTTSILDGQDV